ncbi:MAG: hypothetical protein HFF61_06655 [Oscillospiraceae bacterium]|jgi:hypothetical protein|nr:hypothetical protein [Oscillospiraceae bacterium]
MRLISILLLTLLAGFLGDIFIGGLLHWHSAGAVTAVAVMGAFILHELRSGQDGK